MANQDFLNDLMRALEPVVTMHPRADGGFDVIQIHTGRVFHLDESSQSLAQRADDLTESAIMALGRGSPGSGVIAPGIALLSIHIDEAVATASATDTQLILTEGGVDTI